MNFLLLSTVDDKDPAKNKFVRFLLEGLPDGIATQEEEESTMPRRAWLARIGFKLLSSISEGSEAGA